MFWWYCHDDIVVLSAQEELHVLLVKWSGVIKIIPVDHTKKEALTRILEVS